MSANYITAEDAKAIAQATAKETIRELFVALGVDVSTPAEMIELQRDFTHVREDRLTRLAIKGKIILTIVGAAALGMASMIWLSLAGKH